MYSDTDIHNVTAYLGDPAMRRILPALAAALMTIVPATAGAQEGGLDPASLTAPLGDSWPTYSGDYTGRRYSNLTQVSTETVKHLTLAWTVELNTGMPPLRGAGAPDFVGGEGSGELTIGSQRIKGAILQVGDLLYVTAPDHVWALDARDGSERWHYFWKTRGGPHIGNRGVAVWRDSLFFETVDNYLVALDGADRRGALAHCDRQLRGAVLLDHGADRRRRPPAGRHRQRPGRARLSAVVRPGERRAAVDLLHGPDAAGRPGAGDVAEPGCSLARRRAGLGARGVRPGDQLLHLRHRQPDPRLYRGRTARRQPLHLHADRGRRGDRRDGLVLPDLAARHPRLGLGPDPDPDRRRHRRRAPQAGLDGGAQRLLLHRRSGHRTARRDQPLRRHRQLGQPHPRERLAEPRPAQGSADTRHARVAGRGRGHQLAAAGLQPRHRALLHAGEQRVQPALPDRPGPARVDGARRARTG